MTETIQEDVIESTLTIIDLATDEELRWVVNKLEDCLDKRHEDKKMKYVTLFVH